MSVAQAVRFYRAVDGEVRLPPPDFGDLTLSRWQPHRDGAPTGLFANRTNRAWWLMDRAGALARPDLTVYAIHDRSRLLHRLLVTPQWYRFPFMGPRDLQIGMLWTDPEMRGRGLAAQAIAAVLADFAGCCPALWYVVDEGNEPSIRLIERIGFALAGVGERTRPLGIAALGRFVINPSSVSVRPDGRTPSR